MPKRSKSHHFVPRVLQTPFCFREKEIWYSEKCSNGLFETPELKDTKKSFCINNFYSVLVNGELSDVVERDFYGKIDNYLGNMLPEVFDAFKANQIPTFSGEQLVNLQQVIYEMIKRSPEFVAENDDLAKGQEYLNDVLKACGNDPNQAELKFKVLSDLENDQIVKAYGRDIRVRATMTTGKQIQQLLGGLVVRWSVSESVHSYVLSSSIAYRIGNGGGNGLRHPKMEIWMPISPKIALVLLRDKNKEIPLRLVDTAKHIREVNEYACRRSAAIASHSQKLIESLTKQRSRFGLLRQYERRLLMDSKP